MINLLPPKIKNDILFARRNSELFRWSIMLIIALLGLGLITSGGYLYLLQTTKSYEKQTENINSELKTLDIEGAQKKVSEISGNVSLVTQVLSKEVLFSELLTQLGANMPANTTLNQLQINDIQGSVTIHAQSTTLANGAQIQVNLQDPENKIFDKVDIENITCDTSTEQYPCDIQLKALFAKDSPFYYIKSAKDKKS